MDGTNQTWSSPNVATFRNYSLVAFNAQRLENDVFLQGNNTSINISASSTLVVVNAVEGRNIEVLKDFYSGGGVGISYWQNNLVFSNRMFAESVMTGAGGNYTIQIARASAASTFASLSSGSAAMVDRLYGSGLNDIDSANAGIRYVSRATDQLYGDTGGNAVALAMESFGQLGAVAGVHTTTYHIGQGFADLLVTGRPRPGPRTGCGLSFWATPSTAVLWWAGNMSLAKASGLDWR